jgi:hypothetical protein
VSTDISKLKTSFDIAQEAMDKLGLVRQPFILHERLKRSLRGSGNYQVWERVEIVLPTGRGQPKIRGVVSGAQTTLSPWYSSEFFNADGMAGFLGILHVDAQGAAFFVSKKIIPALKKAIKEITRPARV